MSKGQDRTLEGTLIASLCTPVLATTMDTFIAAL